MTQINVTTYGPDGREIGSTSIALSPEASALLTAQQGIASLYDQVSAFRAQLAADIAAAQGGWDSLTADQRTAIMGRILNAFGTIMQGLTAHATLTGAIQTS